MVIHQKCVFFCSQCGRDKKEWKKNEDIQVTPEITRKDGGQDPSPGFRNRKTPHYQVRCKGKFREDRILDGSLCPVNRQYGDSNRK